MFLFFVLSHFPHYISVFIFYIMSLPSGLHALWYFSSFTVQHLHGTFFGLVNSDLVWGCSHFESCSVVFPSFFFGRGVCRFYISLLTLINCSTHIQNFAATLSSIIIFLTVISL